MTFPGTTLLTIQGVPMGMLIDPVVRAIDHAFENDRTLQQMLQHCKLDDDAQGATERSTLDIRTRTSKTAPASDPLDADASAVSLESGFASLALALRARGVIPGWRDECFSVHKPDGTVWFALERACFRPLGMISSAVHAHAWCVNGDTWLGRRALHKATDPGKLDNLAAGGLTHGEEPFDCMVRELWEEAGVPPHLARHIEPMGQPVLSERAEPEGIHREWLHCYTVELPNDFTPDNRDGEVSGFVRCNPQALQTAIASGEMTADAALCASLALRLRRTE